VKEKRLVDANHFEQVLKNIACALKGELTYGKIKIDVVKLIMGSLEDEPTITAESLQPLTYNENMDYLDCDEFICHKCGIHIEDWKRIKIDPDDGEKELCEYTFKHCPECGAKIIIHKSCEFCRWHLQDGTCFNKHRPKPTTHRESSCWNWEERE
jgi:DNA-directed RNA polymerase subunit RPC12/RpoP